MKFISTIASASILLAVVGCKSSSGTSTIELPGLAVYGLGDQAASDVVTPWLVSINMFRVDSNTPGSGDARVATLEYSATRTVQDHIDFYAGLTEDIDTCEILTSNGDAPSGSSSPLVSGGQSVVINTPSGTWFTIPQGDAAGEYEVNNELPAAIPTDATLSIPGGPFPTVAAIPLREPAPPVRISPAVGSLSVQDEYKWEPVGGAGVFIRLTISEFDANGDFVDFRVGCDVTDDGEFELPIEATNVIASSNGDNTFEVRYTRRHRRIDVIDGVVVYSRISVAE